MRSIALVITAATIVLLSLWMPKHAIAGIEQQVCDSDADYFLGVEDYSEAIRLQIKVVSQHPNNALAHYHLGFAFGMAGDRVAEVKEYQPAEALGLKNWDLFLNLGLAQLENSDVDAATDSLRRSVLFGENQSESHFNLGLVEERRGMLADAEHEMLASLLLNPGQVDARNLLGVIYAQEGNTDRAHLVWRELLRDVPGYEPARTNLAIVGSLSKIATDETPALVLPPRAIRDERNLQPPTSRAQMFSSFIATMEGESHASTRRNQSSRFAPFELGST